MPRAMRYLNGVLLVITIGLVLLLWRQAQENAHWRLASHGREQLLIDLRAQLAQMKAKTRPAALSPPQQSEADPKATAIAQELAELTANRAQAQFRRNAFNGYVSGLDALKLAPATLAQAKDIILASWKAVEDRQKSLPSFEELIAAAEVSQRAMRDQLTALLGQEAAEQIEASQLEHRIHWEIGTDMWDGSAPLAPDQLRALALAQVRVNFKQVVPWTTPSAAQTPDPQTGLSVQDAALLAASASFLAPSQQEILRRNLIEENQYSGAMRGFGEKQRQLWQGSKPGGDPPPAPVK